MKIDFGPQLGETFLSARHDFKIDFMQSCKFDFKIDFLQHWANHAFKGARAITRLGRVGWQTDPEVWEEALQNVAHLLREIGDLA